MPKEFVVFDTAQDEYVASIDTYDGAVTYTSNPRMARIFIGEWWLHHWTAPSWGYARFRIDPTPEGTA